MYNWLILFSTSALLVLPPYTCWKLFILDFVILKTQEIFRLNNKTINLKYSSYYKKSTFLAHYKNRIISKLFYDTNMKFENLIGLLMLSSKKYQIQ